MQTITINDEHGNFLAEATREAVREPWTIRYTDGEERFHGSEAKVRAQIHRRLSAEPATAE